MLAAPVSPLVITKALYWLENSTVASFADAFSLAARIASCKICAALLKVVALEKSSPVKAISSERYRVSSPSVISLIGAKSERLAPRIYAGLAVSPYLAKKSFFGLIKLLL